MSWKPEVHSDSTGRWVGNALRFATKEEAEGNVHAFARRWVSRAVESDRVGGAELVGELLGNIPIPAAGRDPHVDAVEAARIVGQGAAAAMEPARGASRHQSGIRRTPSER
jgi:hypothetical protein